ncbi:MAG: NAD(P)/FAD-dependent oxidoreductase, partial [Nitrospirales bacterium]
MGEAHDTLEVDVLFVGGGPANLAGALRLTQAVSRHNAQVAVGERDGPTLQPQIALIEKGRDVGAHAISGALLDPRALQELLPDFRERECPFSTTVEHHALYCLTPHHAVPLPDWLLPSAYRSTGCYIGSLQQLNLWLAKQVEAAGVYLFPETCGVQVLYDGDRV